MNDSNKALGNFQIVTAFALAGSSVTAGKLLAASIQPFSLAFFSLACALAFLLPALVAERRAIMAAKGRDILLICLQALFGMALFRVFMLSGLSLTSGSHAGIISSLGPLVMGAASMLFLRERPAPRMIVGLALGTAGILLLSLADLRTGGAASSLLGDLLVFAAVSCEAAMSLIRKRSGSPLKPLATAGIIVAASLAYTLPLAAYEWISGGFPAPGPRQALAILYYGAVATALAYYFWAAGSSKVSGNAIALAMTAMPIAAVILSVALLGERPGAFAYAGLVLGIAGMLLGQGALRKGGGRSNEA